MQAFVKMCLAYRNIEGFANLLRCLACIAWCRHVIACQYETHLLHLLTHAACESAR